jgi:hypothetical protein
VTRYQVPVADPLLAEKDFWNPVDGLRLVSADGPWGDQRGVTLCTFDDDLAPARFEGKIVELQLTRRPTGGVDVTGRTVI